MNPTPTQETMTPGQLVMRAETEEALRELEALQVSDSDLVKAVDRLCGNMTPEEVLAFEQRLLHDPALQALVFPILQLRQTMRAAGDDETTRQAPRAQAVVRAVRTRVAEEETRNASPSDDDAIGRRGGTGLAARPGGRWITRLIELIVLSLAALWIASFDGPWSPLRPTWRVVHDEPSLQRQVLLANGVKLDVTGSVFVAERTPGLLNLEQRPSKLTEAYVDAEFFNVGAQGGGGAQLRIITPTLQLRTLSGFFRVGRENGCEVNVTVTDGQVLVLSRRVPGAREVVVGPGLTVRQGCDGTLGIPGAGA